MSQVTLPLGVFTTGKLDCFEQFHCARRVAPILGALGVTAAQIAAYNAKEGADADPDFMGVLPIVFDQIARMPQSDVDYILRTCLARCARQQGDKFAPLMVAERLMFMDVDMPTMIQLVLATLRENLSGFFPTAPDAQS